MINRKNVSFMGLGLLLIPLSIQADAYTDRLIRLTNLIANEYDAQAEFMDAENMTAVALQAINFITVENDISKNSPLGRKNKYITQHAQALQAQAVELFKLIELSGRINHNKTVRDTVLKKLWKVEMSLKQLEGEIAEIKKKQLLPLTSVQKDLINLLALLAAKNLAIAQRMIRSVEKL